MGTLEGKTVLVTGASRGIGKGVAIALGREGAIVFLTGRTTKDAPGVQGLEGNIDQTAREINEQGGRGIPVRCDHTDDRQVQAVFDLVNEKAGRLDMLVNCVWGGYECMFNERGEYVWEFPFEDQPLALWDHMFNAGVRAAYAACKFALPLLKCAGQALIVNISHDAAESFSGNVCYGISKAATNKLTSDLAVVCRNAQVAVVSLYPGMVRTERVMLAKDFLDLSGSVSPQFVGRTIAALYNDPELMAHSGSVQRMTQMCTRYGLAVDNEG